MINLKSNELRIENMMYSVTERVSELELLLFANEFNNFFSQIILFTEELLNVVQEINSIKRIDDNALNGFNHLLVRLTDFLVRKDYVEVFDIIRFELKNSLLEIIE